MPALIGGFGNFLMPLMVGGPDMANRVQGLLFFCFVLSFLFSYFVLPLLILPLPLLEPLPLSLSPYLTTATPGPLTWTSFIYKWGGCFEGESGCGLEFFFWFNCMWPVTYKAKEKNKLRASRPSQPACTINTSSVPLANYNSLNLKSYLAGLFEGDGHIWIQKQKGSKTHNPRFCITFNMKNEALAKVLLDIIGSGFIRYKTKENACVLVVSPVVGLKRIVNLINGELKTPKIRQLHDLIDWLNKNHNAQLEKLPLNKDNIENNSWFSGYVDSDGSFSVQHTKTEQGAKKRKISCRLRIEQRMLDPVTNDSYYDVLNQICLFLNCNLLTKTQASTNNTYYSLAASSKVSLDIIIKYFNKYPLFSSKYLDYKDWEQVAYLIINNQHLTEKGINVVELVRSRMNTKRTEFSWDHLKDLY
jgi:hypothetical protein